MNERKREKHITIMLLIRSPNINQSEAHCFSFMGWLEGLTVNRFSFSNYFTCLLLGWPVVV